MTIRVDIAELADLESLIARDPWDRIIAAQARRRDFDLITADEVLTHACLGWRASTFW